MRRAIIDARSAWVPVGLLLLAACRTSLEPAPAPSAERHAGVLRVLAFNLWQEGTVVQEGFDKIVDVIAAADADVVALSEVRNYEGRDLHERLVQALAARGRVYHGRFGGGDTGLLSRWPITRAEPAVDFTPNDRGGVIAYHLRSDLGRELLVGSAHLDYTNYATYLPRGYDGNTFEMIDPDGDGRPNPVTDVELLHAMDRASRRDDALRGFLDYVRREGRPDLPVLLAGDFNECSHLDWVPATAWLASHNGVSIEWRNSEMLHAAGLRDAWRTLFPDPVTHPGATWPSEAWGRGSTNWAAAVDERDRIDFIYFTPKHLQPIAGWIVGSPRYYVEDELARTDSRDPFLLQDLPWPSDHKAVLVDFAWRD